MGKNSDLRDELLGIMDRETGAAPGASQKAARAVLEKDAAGLRRLRRITFASWFLLAAAFLASGVWGAFSGFRSETWIIASIIGLQAILIAAAALTLALSFRSRTLRMKEIQAALAEIQDKLKALGADRTE